MKNTLLLLILSFGFSISGHSQTVIRFVPEKSLKSTDKQVLAQGKIQQTGHDFSGEVRIELPERKLELQFRRSLIKQYDKIYTSTGQQASQAELYEAVENKEKYYLTTINKQFHSLFLSENSHYSSIEPSKDSFYSYQTIANHESSVNVCGYDSLLNPSSTSNARIKTPAMSACLEFPVAFVCDYRHFIYSNFDIAKIEADNLMRVAIAQEVFAPYAFRAEIVFKAVGNFIYTNQNSFPWTEDGTKPLSEPASDLHYYWQKPEEWKKFKSLVVAGITGINFVGPYNGIYNLWGFARPLQNEFGMGTFIIKGYLNPNESKWIFSHEMGHVFGAPHDEQSQFLMFPTYSTTAWSALSKQSVNTVLGQLDEKKLLRECSKVILTYELERDSLAFKWQTNYDDLADSFIIEYSSDEQKTWKEISQTFAKGVFNYQFRFISKVPLSDVTYYRIRQKGANQIVSNVLRISITDTESLAENVKVFPNPITNQLNIQLPTAAHVTIYTITGKRLLSTSGKQREHTIDTSLWPSGIYFVQTENSSKVYKIIK